MSKREREPATPSPPGTASSAAAWSTVAAIVVLIVLGHFNLREIRAVRAMLDTRLHEIDTGLAQVSARIEQVATRPASSGRGPDPNRVYNIKTVGAPSLGPLTAAVTIVEVSDFQ